MYHTASASRNLDFNPTHTDPCLMKFDNWLAEGEWLSMGTLVSSPSDWCSTRNKKQPSVQQVNRQNFQTVVKVNPKLIEPE